MEIGSSASGICRRSRLATDKLWRRLQIPFFRSMRDKPPRFLLALNANHLSHDIRYEYELNAARFKSWTNFTERGNRRGMRMAYCDGKSVTRGIARGKINLRENRVAICRVVEKHLARCGTDTCSFGGIVGYRRSCRAAINEK